MPQGETASREQAKQVRAQEVRAQEVRARAPKVQADWGLRVPELQVDLRLSPPW